MTFVICSSGTPNNRGTGRFGHLGGMTMTRFSTRSFLIAAALTGLATSALTTSALAQAAAPTAWELKPDMGYGYDKEGKTFAYKMGTNNAGTLLKGAKKVPKGTLFFIGQNGQLYMRTGPYLEGDGKFMFGTN
jgi:hypothetical protein